MHLLKREKGPEGYEVHNAARGLHYDPSQRTVIFLPGRDVADGCDFVHIGSAIKSCERMLAGEIDTGKTPNIFCMTYSEPVHDSEFEAYYRDPEKHISYDASQFVAHMLMPLLNENGGSSRPTHKLMVAELKERLSHVTFVGHSYGSIFAEEVCNALRRTLENNGYTPIEVNECVRDVVTVSIANLALTDADRTGFRSYAFTGSNDMSAQKAIRHYARCQVPRIDEDSPETTDEMKRQYAHDVTTAQRHLLRQTGYNEHYSSLKITPTKGGYTISDRMPLEKQWREFKDGEIVSRTMDKQSSELMHMDIRHDLRNHTIPGHNHAVYPSLLRRVVRNAVVRPAGIHRSDSLFEPVSREEFANTGNFIMEGNIGGEELNHKIREALKQRSDRMLG